MILSARIVSVRSSNNFTVDFFGASVRSFFQKFACFRPNATQTDWGGFRFLRFMPACREFLASAAPEAVKESEGGVERACCVIVLCQILLLGAYVLIFQNSFTACLKVEYMSLSPSEFCDPITITMNDVRNNF